jgi:hypothetical protein
MEADFIFLLLVTIPGLLVLLVHLASYSTYD